MLFSANFEITLLNFFHNSILFYNLGPLIMIMNNNNFQYSHSRRASPSKKYKNLYFLYIKI